MNQSSKSISNLSAAEKRVLLAELLQQKSEAKRTQHYQGLHEWFESQVTTQPEATALCLEGGPLTYQNLNQRANSLAHALLALKLPANALIATYLDRPLEQVTALLAILKIGAVYVPLDPSLPEAWGSQVLETANPVAIVTHSTHHSTVKVGNQAVIVLDQLLAEQSSRHAVNPANPASPDSPACLITADPALAEVSHRNWISHLQGIQKHLRFSRDDTLLLTATPSQNSALWQFLLPLMAGGRLAIGPNPVTLSGEEILEAIERYQATWVHLTPEQLDRVLTCCEDKSTAVSPSLKGALCTGEPLPPTHIDRCHLLLACPLYYSYGLPDIGMLTWQDFSLGEVTFKGPWGQPLRQIYILDTYGQPAPVGVTGTLAVENPLVSRYRNTSSFRSLTANPFADDRIADNQTSTLLKTQQRARRLSDGSLEFIEPRASRYLLQDYAVVIPQVETALLQLIEISDCCVLHRTVETGLSELVAYIVSKSTIGPTQLRQQLQTFLPEPWIPKTFVEVTAIPPRDGLRDPDRLRQLPVVDDSLAHRWEDQILQLPSVHRAAVLIQDRQETLPPLHLADVLHNWQAGSQPLATSVIADEAQEAIDGSVVPALSKGGPLPAPYDRDRTLIDILHRAAEAPADRGCVHIDANGVEQFRSYSELLRAAQSLLQGLRQQGLQPQDRAIFQLANTEDFITAFWACALGGFVPVPISVPPVYEDNHSSAIKLKAIWDMLQHPPILSTAEGAAQLLSLNWATGSPAIINIELLTNNPPDTSVHPCQPDDVALMMLTSGSTGLSKGVPLTHRNLLSMTAGTIVANDFTPAEVTLNWMPMDHVGALVFLSMMSVDLGCQQVHVPTDYILQNPLRWLDLIDRHHATISWAPNFAFTLICDRASDIRQGHWDLSSMKFLVNAGEAVVVKTARNFLKLLGQHGLPSTAIHPAFGMCETCSGISWSDQFSLETTTDDDAFADLGPPIPSATLRIVNDAGEVVSEGVIGQLQLKGPSVTSGYFRRPDANREAFTEDGWFTTGDLGFLRQGSLTITGRLKDIIIINGFNYYSHEIEAAVEELDGIEVSYTAACGVRDGGDTDRLAIFFHSTLSSRADRLEQLKAIRSQINEKSGINPDYLIPIAKEAVPKTAIGKIQRSQLSQRFAQGEFASTLKQID
ncbi:MAG: AMP-binding protein, partial [Cyanobacteria bacterium P01_E01_bin.34]